VGGDLALTAAARSSQGVEEIVADALVAYRSHRALQQEDRVHAGGIEGVREAKQSGFLAVEPEYVAVHDKKRLAEQWQGAGDAPARVEQLRFLGKLDLRMGTAGKVLCHHCRLVMNVDDDALHPGECQAVNRVVDQGATVDLDERLGDGFGNRRQTSAE